MDDNDHPHSSDRDNSRHDNSSHDSSGGGFLSWLTGGSDKRDSEEHGHHEP